MMDKTSIIAHRGASGYTPENTMAAFEKAITMGADGIELDIHVSKDNRLIVCHDERVDRTTNGIGLIKDLTLSEIKKLDAGSWYSKEFATERIPTLEDVLNLLKGEDLIINIELKNDVIRYDRIEELVLNCLEKTNTKRKAILSSFNHHSLIKIKKLDKEIKTGALYSCDLVNPWNYARLIKVDAIHPIYHSVFPRLVKECFNRNLQVNTYTVNTPEDMVRILQQGVTGLITNYPDIAKKML